MAGVKQLVVSGLRSFGADEGDSQHVVFWKPLTLILGENGCGKTTIVEALKFALCDELPPNSDRGKSFVHHPAMDDAKETMAQVKLEFTDAKKSNYLVARSLHTHIRQNTMQFKRLDNYLKIKNERGEERDMSGRCGDINATVASILGVSKAVLDNVIFCHQEESNWPLEEGKKLKERFDAIFDATKYNKCFEYIKKMRKQYDVDMKLLKQKVEHLKEKKQEMEKKKLNLYDQEEKIRMYETKLKTLSEKLEPLKKRLKEITLVENNLVEFRSKRDTAKNRIETSISQQKQLKKNPLTLYRGSDAELLDEIEKFSENLDQRAKLLTTLEYKLEKLKQSEVNLKNSISSSEIKKSELFTLEGQNQDRISERNKSLLAVAEYAGIPKPAHIDDDDESKAMALLSKIKSHYQNKCDELKETENNMSSEENRLQIKIDSCRDAQTRHKGTINNKETQRDSLGKQLIDLKSEIEDANESKSKLNVINDKIGLSDRKIENIKSECDLSTLEEAINVDETKVDQLEEELEKIDKIISELQKQQSKRTEIDVQRESLSQKLKNFTRIKNKNKEHMTAIVGDSIPEKNFKTTFQQYKNSVKNEVEQLQKELKTKRDQVTKLEANRSHVKDGLDKKKTELSSSEEQIYSFCKTQSLDDVLMKLDAEIDKLQDQKVEYSSSEFVIKKFTDKLKNDDPCCPLCHRGFDTQQEVTDLITELEEKVQNVPKNLDSVLHALSKQMKKRDELISLRPLQEKINVLKNADLPALEKKLNDIDKELSDTRNSIDDCMMSLMDPENKLNVIDSLLPDMPLMDQLSNEISNIKNNISKLEAALGTEVFEMGFEDASLNQVQLKQEISELRSAIKSNRLKENDYNKKLNTAREEKNKLTEQYLQIQAKVQELCNLQTRYEETNDLLGKLNVEIESLHKTSVKFKDELSNAIEEKQEIISKFIKNIDKDKRFVSELDKKILVIDNLHKVIQNHSLKDIPGELEKMKVTYDNLIKEKDEVTKSIEDETLNITKIKDDITNQSINKRTLDDNLTLRRLESEQKRYEIELRKIEEKVGELDYESISLEKDKLITSQSDCLLEKARTEGEMKQLNVSVNQIKLELSQSEYRNLEDNYKTKLYSLELLKVADKDIKDYAHAMDCCLMQYHKEKMEKINIIIRELWRSIYRGNDIDYIEIKTDESVNKTQAGNRRVYDYRVIQRRHDVEIDMRGRCSAGQKVLASLIIRMALAETFSNRFGVLALDEPTTNLDRENVTSLCHALRDMVMTRMKQNNFMFIIITHDTEFLDALGSIDKITHYYKVTRNRDGKSRIRKELIP